MEQTLNLATRPQQDGRPSFSGVEAFLCGDEPGPRGYFLDDLLAQDDDFLEACHDFVQWLFPLNSPSAFQPLAPVLTHDELASFCDEARLGTQAAFDRMMGFYGLAYDEGRVTIGANWDARMSNWAVVPTHNSLRLTRILRSLSMQGHHVRARALLSFLLGLFADHSVSDKRREECAYWQQAIDKPWANGLE